MSFTKEEIARAGDAAFWCYRIKRRIKWDRKTRKLMKPKRQVWPK